LHVPDDMSVVVDGDEARPGGAGGVERPQHPDDPPVGLLGEGGRDDGFDGDPVVGTGSTYLHVARH